jgi:hypothetical protein
MRLHRILAGALLAAAAAAGPAAFAQTLVSHTTPVVLTDDGASGLAGLFGNVFAGPGAASYDFADTYVLAIDHPAGFTVGGALTSLYTRLSPGVGQPTESVKDLRIDQFGLYAYANGQLGAEVVGGRRIDTGTSYWGVYDPIERWALGGGWNLEPGSYAVVVRGAVTGNFGGSYAGSVAIVPVPEPQAWAMLLAGLGVAGSLARRRRGQA